MMLQNGTFNWDRKMQGHLLAAYFYGYVVTQLIGGIISDKIGGKLLLLLGLLLTSILTLLSPTIAVYGGFIAFFIVRLLEGMFSVCIMCLIMRFQVNSAWPSLRG